MMIKGKSIRTLASICGIVAMLASVLIAGTVVAGPATTVVVDPTPKTVDQGEQFTLDILVTPDMDITGVQCDISFDSSLITVDSVVEGNLLSQGGANTFFMVDTVDNVAGTITGIAGAIIGTGETVSTAGVFATVTFTADASAGTSDIDLSNVLVADINADPVAIEVTDGSVTVNPLPGAATTVVVDPADKTVDQGEQFTLDVLVTPAEAITGVQCDISFDSSLITVDSVVEGNLLSQGGAGTFFMVDTIDNVAGTITGIAGAIIGTGETVSTAGVFATVTFTADASAGDSDIDLSNVLVADINADPVAIEVTDGSVTVNPGVTTTVVIDPAAKNVNQGEQFTLDVLVTPGQAIAGAQCDISFDPSLIAADSVAEGNLLSQGGAGTYCQPATIDNIAGTITGIACAITTPGETVSGAGVLVTVTFTADASAGTSDIDLSNVVVADVNGDTVAVEVTDGSVTVGPGAIQLYEGMTVVAAYPGVDVDLSAANLPAEAVMVWHQVTADEATIAIPAGTWLHWGSGVPPEFNSLNSLENGKAYLVSATADCVWSYPTS